jgi:hypothetical protein
LKIPKLLLFSLASVVVDLLARFCDISLNKSSRTYLGPLQYKGAADLSQSGRENKNNRQLFQIKNFILKKQIDKIFSFFN